MTRFHPAGRRPWDGGNSDGPFCMLSPEDYIKWLAEQRFVIVQIEDKEAVDCMEDIVATDHVDVFFIGPGDLSHSYGVPGQFDHPLVRDAIDKLAALCKKHKRNWGMPCSPETAPALMEKGARFFAAGADVIAVIDQMKDLRNGFEKVGFKFESRF
jgi:4-hydroxy-2-oxoheptanedioate aldolase